MPIDPLTTFRTLILAQEAVVALVGQRVYRQDMPDQDWQTAQDIQPSMRMSLGPSQRLADSPVVNAQIDLVIYGATAGAAVAVAQALATAIHGRRGIEAGGVYVGGIRQTAGPEPGREEDTDWPVATASYQATFIE